MKGTFRVLEYQIYLSGESVGAHKTAQAVLEGARYCRKDLRSQMNRKESSGTSLLGSPFYEQLRGSIAGTSSKVD